MTADGSLLNKPVYLTSAGSYLPGPPISNDDMESYLGYIAGKPSRLRKRILQSNGIRQRHYALDREGRTTALNEELAAEAVRDALRNRGLPLEQVEMLAVGTTHADLPIPGFASMVHGRLGGNPMELLSSGGVCASSMAALSAVVRAVRTGEKRVGVACGSELVSRLLKASRFESESDGEEASKRGSFRDFDADFLRWMLSDGAGAVVVEDTPRADALSLRVDWIETISHANELPACMYVGAVDKDRPTAGQTWLDFPNVSTAERERLLIIRQDTRILPNIVKLGVEEWLRLVKSERVNPEKIDHVLCHYSSDFFKHEIFKALAEVGLAPLTEKFFSNLETKGNTGAASIYIMLEECLRTKRFQKGDQIILMVPESGRFTVAFAKLTCVDAEGKDGSDDVEIRPAQQEKSLPPLRRSTAPLLATREPLARDAATIQAAIANSPLAGSFDDDEHELIRFLTLELALVWADFERLLRATPILRRLEEGTMTLEDYRRLLINLRQQVMEGARWIARAASSVSIELFPLRSMFIQHAGEEHRDYQMIERDYVSVGGDLDEMYRQPKNVGSEALSSFMFHHAGQPDPLDLVGAMFIIEGLGTRKASEWAAKLITQLSLTEQQVSFLRYHGKNDDDHFERLRDVIRSGAIDDAVARRIVKTAKVTARLYALQLEEIDNV